MIVISLLVTATAIRLAWRQFRTSLVAGGFTALTLVVLLLSGTHVFSYWLIGTAIDESVHYHLHADLQGAAFSEFGTIIAAATVFVLATVTLGVALHRGVRSTRPSHASPRARTVAAFALLLLGIASNPTVIALHALQITGFAASAGAVAPQAYVLPPPGHHHAQQKNIVFLYLESLERTYFDEERFPGLTPNLAALERKALTFTDIHQLPGTSWTIGGMVASQCGVPLMTTGSLNSMSGVDRFLPGAQCLGRILRERDYTLHYLGGANLDFSGKGNFYATHGFDSVSGLHELEHTLADASYRSAWGLYDDTLFELATRRFDALASANQPFGLVALTLDTHHPYGHVSRRCRSVRYGDGSNAILNAVHCADQMAAEFIRHITTHPAFEHTTLVVLSDHLAMRNTAWEHLEQGQRRNLWMIFDADTEPAVIDRPGSLLDVLPTVFGVLGAQTPAHGFGRNLRDADTASLVESEDDAEHYIRTQRPFLLSLWDFPNLTAGMHIHSERARLLLGDRELKLPVALKLDHDLGILEAIFPFHSTVPLASRIAAFEPVQPFIWIDRCVQIASLATVVAAQPDEYCLLASRVAQDGAEVLRLFDQKTIDAATLRQALASATPATDMSSERRARLADVQRHGTAAVHRFIGVSAQNHDGAFILRSAGGLDAGRSHVLNERNDQQVDLARGLSLIGLREDAPPVKLAHVDSCAGSVRDVVELHDDGFANVIHRHTEQFAAFAIIANDSAVCEAFEFTPLFAGTGLRHWNELSLRTPYIALLASDGTVITEHLGAPETAIVLDFRQALPQPPAVSQRASRALPRVAHAGGGYRGQTYSNSIDALNFNRDFFELFELDFSWTSDGHLVCLHNWGGAFQRAFGLEPRGPLRLDEFVALLETHATVEHCTLDTLVAWLQEHPHKRIVTDVKQDNVGALLKVAEKHPELRQRFIPQVYQPNEYYVAKALGYEDVIWTLYRFGGDGEAVVAHLHAMDLYGLTMTQAIAERGLAHAAREARGVASWVHTINQPEELTRFRQLGVTEIYTDWLLDDRIEAAPAPDDD